MPVARGPLLGIVALAVGLVAAIAAPIAGAIAAYPVGIEIGRALGLDPATDLSDLSVFTPVRDWVLVGELSFWIGTALGVWAIVQGVVAIVKRAGRGAGIGAVVVAVLGPVVFAIAVFATFSVGATAGSSVGG